MIGKKESRKREDFTSLLIELSKERLEEKTPAVRAEKYKKLEEIYGDNFKHFYSDIFGVIPIIVDDGDLEALETLGANITLLRNNYKRQKNGVDITEDLRKLYDHINLEIGRLNYGDQEGQISQLRTEMEEAEYQQELLQERLQDAQTRLSEATNKIDETKEMMQNSQKEYIAILGIFASIVLAFTGGMAFSTSVLRYMGATDIYKALTVALVIGIVLANVMFVLLYYISRIIKRKVTLKAIGIANGILVLLLVAVLVAWRFGWVEYRNEKIKGITEMQETVTEQITEKQN